jgi:hypothetical protein
MSDGILVELTLEDIGVALREAPLKPADTAIAMTHDAAGDYNLFDLSLAKNSRKVFTEGGQKIAELSNVNGHVSLTIMTDKQVNIFADLKGSHYNIESQGPVCLQGENRIESEFTLKAPVACLKNQLHCPSAELHVEQGLAMLGPVHCDDLTVQAGYVYQTGDVIVKKHYDLTTAAFRQTETAKTVADEARFLTDHCSITGDFLTQTKLFLGANVLSFGDDTQASTLHFLGESHIHSAHCHILGDTQVLVKGQDADTPAQFIVDHKMTVAKEALVEFELCETESDAIHNEGDLSVTNSFLNTNTLTQAGHLDVVACEVEIYQNYQQQGTTTVNQSLVTAADVVVQSGELKVAATTLRTGEVKLFNGHLSLSDKTDLRVEGNCFLYDGALCTCDNSQWQVSEMLSLNGKSKITQSEIGANTLMAYNNPLSISHSLVRTRLSLTIEKGLDSTKAKFYSPAIVLQGPLSLVEAYCSGQTITLKSSQGRINTSSLISKQLIMEGGNAEQALQFYDSYLSTQLFVERKHVTLNNSVLIGTRKSQASNHGIEGTLHLNNSRLLSADQIHNTKTGKVTASHSSMVQTPSLWNESTVTLEKSDMLLNELLQQQGKLSAQTATLVVQQDAVSQQSDLQLQAGATAWIDNFYHQGRLTLTGKSTLAIKQTLLTDQDSSFNADEATVVAKRFMAHGPAELSKTLLSVDELKIYDTFASREMTQISAKKQIGILNTGHASLTDSHLVTETVDVFGHLSQENGLLESGSLNGWSHSTTELAASAHVKTTEFALLGTLEATSKQKIVDEKPVNMIPQLKIADEFSVLANASVTGTDLSVDARVVNNVGDIDVSGDLYAKGNTFYNTGSLQAGNSLFLGFDDAVVNTGWMSSNRITIHSNFFNIFGGVSAEQSFAASGFVSANLGFIAANNYSNDSLISFKAGLTLPNFSADPEYIFSTQNLMSAAKMGLLSYLPDYANLINLGFMVPALWSSGKGLWDRGNRLGVSGFTSFRRHELMPLICQVKSAAVLGMNAVSTAQEAHNATTKMPETPAIGPQLLGLLGGNYTENSLINLNLGLTAASNTSSTSFLHVNNGVEYSLFNHNISTYGLYNSGYSAGGTSAFLATSMYNAGTLQGRSQLSLKANNLHNAPLSQILAKAGVAIQLDTLQQEGVMDVANGRVDVKKFTAAPSAKTAFSKILATGEAMKVAGAFSTTETAIEQTALFETDKNTQWQGDRTRVKADEISHEGNLSYQHSLLLHGQKVTLSKDSVTTGATTAKSENTNPPTHTLTVYGKQILLDGQQRGGDRTTIGQLLEKGEVTKAELIRFGQEADLLFQAPVVLLADELFNDARFLSQDQLTIRAGTIHNGQTGQLAGTGSFDIEAKQLDQNGLLSLTHGRAAIERINLGEKATTRLTKTHASGEAFNLQGKVELTDSLFEYNQHFIGGTKANWSSNNVKIATGQFKQQGQLAHQNGFNVKANTATLAEGSSTTGAVSSMPTKPNETFVPKHTFIISANTTTVAGKQRGGDYTRYGNTSTPVEQAPSASTAATKAKKVIFTPSADVDLTNGSIHAETVGYSGRLKFTLFEFDVNTGTLHKGCDGSITQSTYQGDRLTSAGKLRMDASKFNVKKLTFTNQGREHITHSEINSGNFQDASQLTYGGQTFIKADHYAHTGHVAYQSHGEARKDSLFLVQAKTAELKGSGRIARGQYDLQTFNHGAYFVKGILGYENYVFQDSLNFLTDRNLTLNGPRGILRDCDINVQAKDIYMGVDDNRQRKLGFISTQGDVTVASNVTANALFIKSAANINTCRKIETTNDITFAAKGWLYNRGGSINGNTVQVTAGGIKNMTRDSDAAKSDTGYYYGDSGLINGRQKTLLESTTGNIENHGGAIRAGDYLQMESAKDILNLCNVKTVQGAHDVVKVFDPGLIAGGNGSAATKGLGMLVHAKGKVKSDASQFTSNGDNYISGDQGVDLQAQHHTYISTHETKKTWHGFSKKHTVATSTTVAGSTVHSNRGRNIIRSEAGEVHSVASRFTAQGGTDIYANHDVKLQSLQTHDRSHSFKSKWWGLECSKRNEVHAMATPTLFIDQGLTRVHSATGGVDLRGALFLGSGDLEIQSAKRVKFGLDVLDHRIVEKTRTVSVSGCGMGAWKSLQNGGSIWNAATSEDATLAKLNSLAGSQNEMETLANASNLGIDLYNTSNSFLRGMANDSLGSEAMSRYGLGGAEGFAPTITVSISETTTTQNYQTLGPGGVHRGGNVRIVAGEGVDLMNGVQIQAGKNIEIDAPELIAKAAALESSMSQKTETVSVSGAPGVGITDVGASVDMNKSKSVNHVNAGITAGGNLTLHHKGGRMQQVVLEGANLRSDTLDLKTQKLHIISKQDTFESHSESYSASTSGNVSANNSTSSSKKVAQQAGIYVEKGINNGGHQVDVGETTLVGGQILTNGVNDFPMESIVSATQLQDEEHSSGMGISFNVNEVARLGDKTPTNLPGEKAIATVGITREFRRFEAVHTSVIHGTEGTAERVNPAAGPVHTSSANGTAVKHDEHYRVALDVPLTNQAYIAQSQQNMREGYEKLHTPPTDSGPLQSHCQETPVFNPIEIPGITEVILPNDTENPKSAATVTDHEPDTAPSEIPSATTETDTETTKKPHSSEGKEEKAEPAEPERTMEQRALDGLLAGVKMHAEGPLGHLTEVIAKEYGEDTLKLLANPATRAKGLAMLSLKTQVPLVTFLFNIAISNQQGKKGQELFREATSNTAGDIIGGLTLQQLLGTAATPVGMVWTAGGILDSMVYDQKTIDAMFARGYNAKEAAEALRKDGKHAEAFFTERFAADQMQGATDAEIGHHVMQLPSYLGKGIKAVWDKLPEAEAATNDLMKRGIESKEAAESLRQQGKTTEAFFTDRMAAEQLQTAAEGKVLYELAKLPKYVGEAAKELWNTATQQKLPTPLPPVSDTQHRFFSNSPGQDTTPGATAAPQPSK